MDRIVITFATDMFAANGFSSAEKMERVREMIREGVFDLRQTCGLALEQRRTVHADPGRCDTVPASG